MQGHLDTLGLTAFLEQMRLPFYPTRFFFFFMPMLPGIPISCVIYILHALFPFLLLPFPSLPTLTLFFPLPYSALSPPYHLLFLVRLLPSLTPFPTLLHSLPLNSLHTIAHTPCHYYRLTPKLHSPTATNHAAPASLSRKDMRVPPEHSFSQLPLKTIHRNVALHVFITTSRNLVGYNAAVILETPS